MAHYSTEIRTPRSVDEVFAYMSDLRKFTEWDPGTVTATQVHGDGPGPAAAYDLEVVVPIRNMTLRYETIEYDPPRKTVVKGANRVLTSTDTITVRPDPDGGGSILRYDAVVTLNGPLGVFDKVLAKGFQKTGDKAAAGIERVLDGTRV